VVLTGPLPAAARTRRSGSLRGPGDLAYNPRAMPNKSRRSADDRAEARRRSRQAARGTESDQEAVEDEEEPAASSSGGGGGSLLSRLFPPAPPLPGREDPLKGFTYTGPLRRVVAYLYLLVRNPLPWLLGGTLWAAGQLFRSDSLVGIVALFASFAGLIGAGWFGWQRPWLFGLAAGIVGWLVLLGAFFGLSAALPATGGGASPSASVVAASPSVSPSASIVESPGASASASPEATPSPSGASGAQDVGRFTGVLITELLFQGGLGGFAGWYGGYLRRRTVATSSNSSGNRGKRRR
jgi:hypothetical protein